MAADISLPFTLEGAEVDVTVSIGIALWGQDEDGESLMRRADAAMYRAKSVGGGVVCTGEDAEDHVTGANLHGDLRRAIMERNPALHLNFQPIVCLENGRVVRLEALARWHHPRLGPVSPLDFVAVAERHGLIWRLTELLADQAVAGIRLLAERGLAVPTAFNVSAPCVGDDLVELVRTTLQRHGVPPELLCVEITETATTADNAASIRALQALRSLGVTVSLDDFGAGYSNLARLGVLPIDHIKLDRSLIEDLGDSSSAAAVIRFAVALAEQMGTTVVAEGIEKVAQAEELRALGCHHGQGFLYWRPAPIETIAAVLERQVMPIPSQHAAALITVAHGRADAVVAGEL